MTVIIVSPEKTLFSGEADLVAVPGAGGRFEVLTGHAPIITTLAQGRVCCKQDGKEIFTQAVSGGFCEVSRNRVSLCVEL